MEGSGLVDLHTRLKISPDVRTCQDLSYRKDCIDPAVPVMEAFVTLCCMSLDTFTDSLLELTYVGEGDDISDISDIKFAGQRASCARDTD